MKILILPLFIILLPVISLYLIIKYWKKDVQISRWFKITLGVVFFIIGLIFSYFAILVSIWGYMDKGIKCASGVVALIPLSLFVNIVGIPLILLLKRKIHEKTN